MTFVLQNQNLTIASNVVYKETEFISKLDKPLTPQRSIINEKRNSEYIKRKEELDADLNKISRNPTPQIFVSKEQETINFNGYVYLI